MAATKARRKTSNRGDSAGKLSAAEAPLSPIPPGPLAPLYTIRIHGVATSDDNGGNASPVTAAKVSSMMAELNQIYASARIVLVFDPSTDFDTQSSTLLNQRFAVVGNLANFTDPEVPPATDNTAFEAARRSFADQHRDKVTIFFAVPLKLEYNASLGHWTLVQAGGGGSSGGLGRWVSWKQNVAAPDLAHEIGHYLHNTHPFVGGISNVADAANSIKAYVNQGHPIADGLRALDGDRPWVLDTPADAAGSIFESVYGQGSKCGPNGTISIPVDFGGGQTHTYTLAPDRGLVMSYFKGCFADHFSSDQGIRSREALEMLNRRALVSIKPSPQAMKLQYLDSESAGAITDVRAARIGRRRLATATSASNMLKLIAWDIDDAGVITRKGDTTVGAISGPFAITNGGLDQVLVGYRDGSGDLSVRSYSVNAVGDLTLADTESAGAISDLAIVRTDQITFVTPLRLPSGVLRVIAWRIFADGTIGRQAHADGGVVTAIESVSYSPASAADESAVGAVTIFARSEAGNLSVQAWRIDVDDKGAWHVVMAGTNSAGATTDMAVASLDFDLAASVIRTPTDQHKVILWTTDYSGTISRKGDFSAGACSRVAAAPIGVNLLATGCREPVGDGMVMRLFEVSNGGTAVTLRDQAAPLGTATELVLVPVGRDKVVAALRSTSGALVLRSFGVVTGP